MAPGLYHSANGCTHVRVYTHTRTYPGTHAYYKHIHGMGALFACTDSTVHKTSKESAIIRFSQKR